MAELHRPDAHVPPLERRRGVRRRALLYAFGHYVVTHERGVREVAEACLEARGYTFAERNSRP